MFCCLEPCNNLVSGAQTPHAGENMRADIMMLLFRQGIHRIFGKHLVVAMLIGLTSRSVDPEAGGNTAQDDGTDAATTQLQVQVRAKEGSPLMLGDQMIQGLRSQFRCKLSPAFESFCWQRQLGITDWTEHILTVNRVDVDQNNETASTAKGIG